MTAGCPDPQEIDARWMTDVMREAGLAGDAVVESVDLEAFIGTGQMGRNARYRLSWSGDVGGPETVVAKFPG